MIQIGSAFGGLKCVAARGGMILCALVLLGGVGRGQTYLDNESLYLNQDPNNETRRSDHFRLNFGHYNRDTGTPVTEEFVQGNLQMFEHAWNRWVVDLGLHDINESVTNPDGNKYRANFNMLMTWNDGGGGGAYSSMDSGGFGYAMANSGSARFDPPSGATPHEFGHAWQITAGGFNGTNSSGSWWEGHANWMQLQFLNSYPQARGYIENGMYYPSHGRDYYDSFMIWEEARENPAYGAAWVNEMWTNATPEQQVNEYMIERMVRLDWSGSPDKAGAIGDLWGSMAKKLVTWDYERQQWLAQANRPDDGSDWSFYQRTRTPLVKMAGEQGWFRPSRDHLPMQYGFNIIPLDATAGSTVSCDFQPQGDPVRQSDWRACLVAVNATGEASYSSMWNKGVNSILLSADQSRLYLVVIATPKPMAIAEPVWNAYLTDAGRQFPYAVSFVNGAPKNVIYPVPSHGGMRQHANGGGWVSNGATVAASAYVGPNAHVLGSAQVLGNARVEDFAVVRDNAKVRDNAVVSGHGMVRDKAQVYGNAKVRDWGRVFGYAEVYENGKVIEHGNCGDGDAGTHTRVYGNAIVKGTSYVYNTSTLNGSIIMEGDSANGNGTIPSSKGVHFGWGWGNDVGRFNGLVDNGYLYAGHGFEKDNAVFALDEFGINHGFLMNGSRVAVDGTAPVRGGRVLPLDGASQYVELHNSVNDFKDSSYAVWFKWAGGAADQKIWSMGDGDGKVMSLTPKDGATGGLRFVISDGVTTHTLDGPVIAANTWRHVAVVFSGGSATLYLDGVSVANTPAVTVFPDKLNAPLMENANFLGRGNGGDYFAGKLDDFRAYMKSLSAGEVAAVFGESAPTTVPFAADATAPTPNAATWLVEPVAVDDTTVTMSATPGSDSSGWVEYYFECVSGGGNDSGWVSFHKYTDADVAPSGSPSYTVRMRDRAGNTTTTSGAAAVSGLTSGAGSASFSVAPTGIANGQISMTAAGGGNASGKTEYKFDRTLPTPASSGWRSSPTWTQSGLSTGASYTYTVTVRDGRGNTSSPSAPASAVARDDAGPALPMAVAHWQMLPYATIDNRVSMTAQTASDPGGVEYYFECVSGGGNNSSWQSNPTFKTSVLADGSYSYRYKVRDKSGQRNESVYSTSYTAKITPTTGYHSYTLNQVLTGNDDDLVSFPATVMRVNSDHYEVMDLATGSTMKVRPDTYGLVTNPALALKNVLVKGHLYTFSGVRVVTYASLSITGDPLLYTIAGRVTDSLGGGIAGATVSFSDVPDASGNAIITTTTNSSGYYSRGVSTGTWYVAASSGSYNTSADQIMTVNSVNISGVDFSLITNAIVNGTVVRCSDGAPVAGALVYFSMSPEASGNPVFIATTDSGGNYSQPVQDGVWYVAAAGGGYYTSVDKTIVVSGSAVGGIDFGLQSSARSIPRTSDLLFSAVSDNLPASGQTGAWPTYEPSGQTLTPMGFMPATVETIGGARSVKNQYDGQSGFLQGTYSSDIPVNGATIVVVARPERNTTNTSWTSIVDVFYDRLVLGIRNSTGRIDVRRNGSQTSSTVAIPDGQTTILSLVVQPDGKYKVFANGVQVVNVTSTSDMSALVPNIPGPYANGINVGRNNPDAWTTFNGNIGDVFVYKVALSDAERLQIEADLSTKFLTTDPMIMATAGTGGSINPMGAVAVCSGGNQTFSFSPQPGYSVAGVSVNGVPQGALASYTFANVTADQNINVTFVVGSNALPTISDVPDQAIVINASTGVLPFTVGDAESLPGNLIVTGGSSNLALVPSENVVIGGAGANRNVTVTPLPGTTGTTTITLTVGDGVGFSSSEFLLTVDPVSGTPTIEQIGDQSITANQSTSVIPVIVGDSDTNPALLTLSGTSSNSGLIPNGNIVFGGSGTNRSVVITPVANVSGSAQITLTVSDGTYTAAESFTITVEPGNGPPSISAIADQTLVQDSAILPLSFTVGDIESDPSSLTVSGSSSNQLLITDSSIQFGGSGANRTISMTVVPGQTGTAVITLVVSDGVDSATETFSVTVRGASASISMTFNANRTLEASDVTGAEVAAGNWNNLLITGGSQNGTWSALHDSDGSPTSASITSAGWNSIVSMSTNGSPFFKLYEAGIAKEGEVPASDATITLQNIPFSRYDVYVYYTHFPLGSDTLQAWTEGENGTTQYGTNNRNHGHDWGDYVGYQTSERALAVAQATSGGDGGGNWLKFTGLTDSTLTLTSSDTNGPDISGYKQRGVAGIQIVNVTTNSAPSISDVADQTVEMNTPTAVLPITVDDSETPATALVVIGSSSNLGLVPNENIVIGGSGNDRTVSVTPASDQFGTVTITLTVSDGELEASDSFVLTVDDSFTTWQKQKFEIDWDDPAIAGPQADPDLDGKPNSFEFALNGNPRDGSDTGLWFARLGDGADGDSDEELILICAVRRGAVFSANVDGAQESALVEGMSYLVEGATDLSGVWNSAVGFVGFTESAPSGSNLPDLSGTGWHYAEFSGFNSLPVRGFMRIGVQTP
jgi:hypothetical protein